MWGIMLYPPFKYLCLSVCPFVRQHFVFTLYWEYFFIDFLQTWYKELIMGRSLGIADG